MVEKKSWIDKLSETVDKATKAATEAWDGTADTRKDAWEKTKTAASSASDAFDEGVEKVKSAYRGESGDETDPEASDPVEVVTDEIEPPAGDDDSEMPPSSE